MEISSNHDLVQRRRVRGGCTYSFAIVFLAGQKDKPTTDPLRLTLGISVIFTPALFSSIIPSFSFWSSDPAYAFVSLHLICIPTPS
jgi:hypothetical protein